MVGDGPPRPGRGAGRKPAARRSPICDRTREKVAKSGAPRARPPVDLRIVQAHQARVADRAHMPARCNAPPDRRSWPAREVCYARRSRADVREGPDPAPLDPFLRAREKLTALCRQGSDQIRRDRKITRLNSSHPVISYAVFCLKKKRTNHNTPRLNSSHLAIKYAGFCFKKLPTLQLTNLVLSANLYDESSYYKYLHVARPASSP